MYKFLFSLLISASFILNANAIRIMFYNTERLITDVEPKDQKIINMISSIYFPDIVMYQNTHEYEQYHFFMKNYQYLCEHRNLKIYSKLPFIGCEIVEQKNINKVFLISYFSFYNNIFALINFENRIGENDTFYNFFYNNLNTLKYLNQLTNDKTSEKFQINYYLIGTNFYFYGFHNLFFKYYLYNFYNVYVDGIDIYNGYNFILTDYQNYTSGKICNYYECKNWSRYLPLYIDV